MVTRLTIEQYVWLMTLTLSERRRYARLLATGLWTLEWSGASRAFELKQI